MLKAIVFDFDGVLVDSEPLHCRAFQQVALTLGWRFTYQEYLDRYVGFDDRDAWRTILRESGQAGANDEQRIEQLVQAKGDAFADVVQQGVSPIPGALELIEQLPATMPIAIASGATLRDIDLILRQLRLRERFDTIITANDVAHSKPDPQTYRLAVQRLQQKFAALNLQPSECLAIEDTVAGIASARGAGLMTLGLATTSPAATLHTAHRVVPSLTDVTLNQLQKWFA